MGTVILLRHGRSSSNTAGTLAGRSPEVALDEHGEGQAQAVAARLSAVPLVAVVTSPLKRCQQTVAPVVAERSLQPQVEERINEVDYGEWTGLEIKKLAKEPLWKVVQQHPSAAVFPGGEGLAAMQARAVAAIRDWDRELTAEHQAQTVWLACCHGDVIKAILADALGIHLDGFQRLMVDPASISVIHYTDTRPFVARMNDGGGDVSDLVPPKRRRRRRTSEAVVGGNTGA